MSSGPSPVPVLVAALAVLLGGIAAVALHDDGSSTVAPPVLSSNLPSTTAVGSTTRTSRAPSSTGPTTSLVATTVRPAVGSPEAAANGLWAAYTASNRTAAQRFATDDVIRVLFQEQYNGEPGTFLGCRRADDRFDCRYAQSSANYEMTVKADDAGSFRVVELTVSA